MVIVAPAEAEAKAGNLFQAGLACARRIKGNEPNGMLQTNWVKAASFARRNGSGASITIDPETKSWVLAAGTWFHTHGYASGSESYLLSRVIEIGVEPLAHELEGFFVIVFGDALRREIFVITDVIGSRHCFARSIGQIETISTSSLLLASLADCALDGASCEEFIRTGSVYQNRTFFRGVKKIGPAEIVRFAGGRIADVRRYWSMAQLDPESFDGGQAVRLLSENLVGAAQKVGRTFARPVCDLTGGYDSRALVAAFLAAGVEFETTVAGAADSADVIVSNDLSKITAKPHRHLDNDATVSHAQLREALALTDGGYDSVDYARIFSLHRRLSAQFDISINGSFGELARGYWWELLQPGIGRREPVDSMKLARRRYVVDPSPPELFSPEENERFMRHFTEVIDEANAGLAGWPNTALMDNTYLNLRMQHWQGRIASSTDQVWPCLSPFMLRSVLEIMLQIRSRLRYRSRLVRTMLAELHPQLAAHPLEHGYPPLPVTWQTWPRFLPALKVLAKKSRVRIEGRLLKVKDAPASPGFEPRRLRLWRESELRQLLEPEKMRIGELIEASRLKDFLDSSRTSIFQYDQHWNRILTLEMALGETKVLSAHEWSSGGL
jgi:asparagine synthase (glutamine-hydrolysing)